MSPKVRYRATQFALLINLLGAVLLIVGFQATSTNLTVIVGKDNSVLALCAYNDVFISWVDHPLPPGPNRGPSLCLTNLGQTRALAGVVFENGVLIPWGFALIVLGTIAQILLLEPPPRAPNSN